MSETTIIETEFGNFVNCNNCGAYALEGIPINHYVSCRPGEAKKWEELYERTNDEEEHIPFVTVYKSIGGWKAQILVWNNDDDDGFWEPAQVSHFGYDSVVEAVRYAKEWASAEDIEFVEPTSEEYRKEVGYEA